MSVLVAAHRNAARNTYRVYSINSNLIDVLFAVQFVCENTGRTEIPFSATASVFTKLSKSKTNRVAKYLGQLGEKSFIKIRSLGKSGKQRVVSITPLGQFAMKLHTDTVNSFVKHYYDKLELVQP